MSVMASGSGNSNTPCTLCTQSFPECDRARRSANRFSLKINSPAFESGVEVPCGFKTKLDILCSGGNYMTVKGGKTDPDVPAFSILIKHHLWIDRGERCYILCGPMWKSLCEAYKVEIGDTLTFSYEEELKLFSIEVLSDEKKTKPFDCFPVCWNLEDICEDTLKRTIFSDPYDVSQEEMNAINYAMHELVLKKEHEQGDFLYIHRLDSDEMNKLELPIEIYGPNRKIPETGIAMYGFGKEVVHGSFKVKEGGRIIKFKNNWSEFRAVARLREKSIMFAAIHFAEHWISINIIKIITNTLKLFPNEWRSRR